MQYNNPNDPGSITVINPMQVVQAYWRHGPDDSWLRVEFVTGKYTEFADGPEAQRLFAALADYFESLQRTVTRA